MIDEILSLGFNRVELSHGLSLSLLPGIMQRVRDGAVEVAGVHNFFPAPLDVQGDAPDAFQFTSHRPAERRRAMDLTKRTIERAVELKARYVVLHMGSIPLLPSREASKVLEKMARQGLVGSPEYAAAKGEIVRKRAHLAPIYAERARVALHDLADFAKDSGLVLGVEGRSHLEQIPGEEEVLSLMEEFAEVPQVGYWHDFGHIQRKHHLLLLDHEQFLAAMQPFLVGAHVNDVRWPARDHRVPFAGGSVAFSSLTAFFKAEMPLSWELGSSCTAEEIVAARERWDAEIGK